MKIQDMQVPTRAAERPPQRRFIPPLTRHKSCCVRVTDVYKCTNNQAKGPTTRGAYVRQNKRWRKAARLWGRGGRPATERRRDQRHLRSKKPPRDRHPSLLLCKHYEPRVTRAGGPRELRGRTAAYHPPASLTTPSRNATCHHHAKHGILLNISRLVYHYTIFRAT